MRRIAAKYVYPLTTAELIRDLAVRASLGRTVPLQIGKRIQLSRTTQAAPRFIPKT